MRTATQTEVILIEDDDDEVSIIRGCLKACSRNVKQDEDVCVISSEETKVRNVIAPPQHVAETARSVLQGVVVSNENDRNPIGSVERGREKYSSKTILAVPVFVFKNVTLNFAKTRENSFDVICKPQGILPKQFLDENQRYLRESLRAITHKNKQEFNEWLMKEGLIRQEQYCSTHSLPFFTQGSTKRSLQKMYRSPTSSQAGFEWKALCCPNDVVSVYRGSLFEGCLNPKESLYLLSRWASFWEAESAVSSLARENTNKLLRIFCSYYTRFRPGAKIGDASVVDVSVFRVNYTGRCCVEVILLYDRLGKEFKCLAAEIREEDDDQGTINRVAHFLHRSVHLKAVVLLDSSLHPSRSLRRVVPPARVIATENPTYKTPAQKYIDTFLIPFLREHCDAVHTPDDCQLLLDELIWREKHGLSPRDAFQNLLRQIGEETRRFEDPAHKEMDGGLLGVLKNISRKIIPDPSRSEIFPICNEPKAIDGMLGSLATGIDSSSRVTGSPRMPDASSAQISDTLSPVKEVTESSSAPSLRFSPVKVVRTSLSPLRTSAPGAVVAGSEICVPMRRQMGRRSVQEPFLDVSNLTSVAENYYVRILKANVSSFSLSPRKVSHSTTESYECQFASCSETFENVVCLSKHYVVHVINGHYSRELLDCVLCRICFRLFENVHQLERHLEYHYNPPSNAFECQICKMIFWTRKSFLQHFAKEHRIPGELPYVCTLCSFRTACQEDMMLHSKECHGKCDRLLCHLCLRSFSLHAPSAVTRFMSHIKLHLSRKMGKYKCRRCCLAFTLLRQFQAHKKDHIICSNIDLVPIEHLRDDQGGRLLICGKDGFLKKPKIYKDKSDSVVWRPDVTELICQDCQVPFSQSAHFKAIYRCTHCTFESYCTLSASSHQKSCSSSVRRNVSVSLMSKEVHYCPCGFKHLDGGSMAQHLAQNVCPFRTACQSSQSAVRRRNQYQSATFPKLLPSGDEETTEEHASAQWKKHLFEDSLKRFKKRRKLEDRPLLRPSESHNLPKDVDVFMKSLSLFPAVSNSEEVSRTIDSHCQAELMSDLICGL